MWSKYLLLCACANTYFWTIFQHWAEAQTQLLCQKKRKKIYKEPQGIQEPRTLGCHSNRGSNRGHSFTFLHLGGSSSLQSRRFTVKCFRENLSTFRFQQNHWSYSRITGSFQQTHENICCWFVKLVERFTFSVRSSVWETAPLGNSWWAKLSPGQQIQTEKKGKKEAFHWLQINLVIFKILVI